MKMCPMCVVVPGLILGLGAASLLGGAGEKPAPAAAPAMAADAYTVDSVHSFATFRVKHMNVSYSYGRFDKIEGKFDIDPAKPEACMIDMTVDASSINTGNDKRDQHLKSQDFFSVKEFPTLTFKSKSFKKAGDALTCEGDLTLHGVTKTITIPVELVGQGEGRGGAKLAGFESKFTIKRSDFGMNFMLQGIGDEITVMVSAEGGKK